MNMQDSKYQQKSKSIPPLEQNYFSLFAMRYPVSQTNRTVFQKSTKDVSKVSFLYFGIFLRNHLDYFLSQKKHNMMGSTWCNSYAKYAYFPPQGASLYSMHITSSLRQHSFFLTHPLCQHKCSTERQQKLPFSDPTHLVLLLT